MNRNPSRPMSPHLTHYKWGPHMLVSILHRITGDGGAIVGGALLVWWLSSLAEGPETYAKFAELVANPWALILWVPLTWGLIQHSLSGIRHFVMDIGAGYELGTSKIGSIVTLVLSVLLTAALWACILHKSGVY
jgi:succinate dehydrogenase / fumarate reductase cytochrome b subunit